MNNKEEPVGKKLRKFSMETRLASTKDFRKKALEKFGDYIKAIVVWGSVTRGDYTGKSDVDIYIIFDDTKASIKDFNNIRERIDKDISKIAHDTDPRLHPQPILALTEFMDGIRNCHPLFFNIVREGFAIHDTGFFIPMRKLLEWGHFPATAEAAEMRMESVPKRIDRVENVKLYMIAEDLYYAVLDAAQAVLMYVGVGPPAPKVAAREIRKHLVEAGLLKEEYAKILEDTINFRKAVEHKEIKKISGQEVDDWIKKVEDYIKVFEELLKNLETNRKAEEIKKNYEVMIKASVAALKTMNKLPEDPKKLGEAFKKYLIEAGKISPVYADVFDKVVGLRKALEDKKIDKIPDRDIYSSKEYVRRFVGEVQRAMQNKGEYSANKNNLEQRKAVAEGEMTEAKQHLETAEALETEEKIRQESAEMKGGNGELKQIESEAAQPKREKKTAKAGKAEKAVKKKK